MTKPKTRDRLSIHLENGQSNIQREAVTILRDGGTASQSGLVGITNATYDPTDDCNQVVVPETIFNVQSTGDSNIRFSSGPSTAYRSAVEILGNGNTRSSGLLITYDPELDNAFVVGPGYDEYGEFCVDPNTSDNCVADFHLIRASGQQGAEFSHITMSERGYVGVGLVRRPTSDGLDYERPFDNDSRFYPVAPLTIAYVCDDHMDSGTIAIHEQAVDPPLHESAYGKIYVKPFTTGGRSQALYFQDDDGNVTNLVLSQDLDPSNASDGLIYGNNGNTYGGWYTPKVRQSDSDKSSNTYYGWGAGFSLSDAGTVTCNTLVGHNAGSGLTPSNSNQNTVVGCDSLRGFTSAQRNVVIGDGNANTNSEGTFGGMDDSILIGRNLYQNDLPVDGTLAIGAGQSPLITGKITGNNRFLKISEASFEVDVDNGDSEFKLEFDVSSRHTLNFNTIDNVRSASQAPRTKLDFKFLNLDNNGPTLFTLDPFGTELTNNPTYQEPSPDRPFAQLEGDFKLRGAIRFQDGTSMSGLSEFNIIPLEATSGINKLVINNEQILVLDYSELQLAGDVSSNIKTDNTFVAVQLDGTNSDNVGKMSLQGLADYVSSGTASIAENCNILIASPENELDVNTAANKNTVMIGCEVGSFASGWLNSVMIGNQAGSFATTPNAGLSIDSASVFIGYRAGYDMDNVYRSVCIGNGAGENADGSTDSVFIGSSAGYRSNYDESMGLGEWALASVGGSVSSGSGNLEIVTGKSNNQRLFYPTKLDAAGESRSLNDRMNIQNVIAGRVDRKNISIGDARLSPTSPLEVRRESSIHALNPNNYVQSWFCDDSLVAALDCDGNFISFDDDDQALPNIIEGLIESNDNGMSSPNQGTMSTPTSGILRVYENGAPTNKYYYIKNRDSELFIENGTYVVATVIGDSYRPIWVSCT